MKAGDKVTVFNGRLQPESVQTVARIAGRKVVLDDGTCWTASLGTQWGNASSRREFGRYPTIGPHVPRHDVEIRRRYLLDRIARTKWEAYPDYRLERVVAALDDVVPVSFAVMDEETCGVCSALNATTTMTPHAACSNTNGCRCVNH